MKCLPLLGPLVEAVRPPCADAQWLSRPPELVYYYTSLFFLSVSVVCRLLSLKLAVVAAVRIE